MNPFYFGTSERRLFGIYEPAAFGNAGKRAAILCHPWGPEYLHAHRTMRQLSLKLAAAGFHTLRFDYFGTGDSGGEPIDTDLMGWETDIEMAIEEMKDIAGTTKITLIGLRLGADAAAGVAARLSKKVEALVLWDPIASGSAYLQHLGVSLGVAPPLEVLGFPLAVNMMRDLRALDLSALLSKKLPPILMLTTEGSPSDSAVASSAVGAEAGATTSEFIADVRPWIESSVNAGMVPFAVIQRIIAWLE
ncbi:MAG: alpha/beta hydrolase [Aliidongia sp.]